MKHIIIMIGVIGLIGCNTTKTTTAITPNGIIRVPAYEIGAYTPQEHDYNYKTYDAKKTTAFLASITLNHSNHDIVSVDGLKWQLQDGYWQAYPNPPIPVLEDGEDRGNHCRKYAEWIDQHPHFGYPPLPLQK